MNKIARSLIGLALAPGLFSITAADAAIKCWTNHEGVRECGNSVPPEFAQQETRTVNDRGITLDVQRRAKTSTELQAEEENKQQEQERVAEEQRQREVRAKADGVLLETFASEQDIVMARDRKITALEGSVEFTSNSLSKHQGKIEDYKKRIANLERSGNPISEDIRADLAAEQQKLDSKIAFIAAKRAEIQAIRAEYEGYLVRYREIMQQRGQ